MTSKRALFFDGVSITVLLWQRGQVTQSSKFNPDPVGFESFSEYLARDRSSPVHVLADVGEEGFQLEAIPSVQGADRDALIKRRLGQFFFGTPFSLGLSLGRKKDGRRDESILFTALTRPESLTPWLEQIRKAGVPLAGVYSVPLVLADISRRVVGQQGRFLLVTLSNSGLRQTFFSDGQLQFSRLSQLATHSRDEFSLSCSSETNKTYQYLVGQRQLARNSPLTACIVAHPGDLPQLRAQCRDTGNIQFQFIDLATLAGTSGLKSSLKDSCGDALLVHSLLARTPKVQFAPEPERKLYRIWQLRLGLNAASMFLILSALLIGGRLAAHWSGISGATEIIRAQTASDEKSYQTILEGLPKTQLTTDNLRALSASFEQINRRSLGPTPMLAHLSEALEVMPSVTLQKVEWKLADKLDSGKNTVSAVSSLTQPDGTGGWGLMDVHAQLPIAIASNQRKQIEVVESLATRLRADNVAVDIVRLPVDIESGKAFKRGQAGGEQLETVPTFQIRLTKAF